MKTGASLKNRQGGAVAVMVGISMVMLVGFLALVIDLGHLYIAKTELQNAADAAALSGAKQLNGTYSSCCDTTNLNSGVNKAIAIAAQNRYDFSKPVDITIANISVGNCPDPRPVADGGCMVSASSVTNDTMAANKYFIKVDTGSRPLDTWFANIWNTFTTRTFGMAVAGRTKINITPIAMCAVDVRQCPCLSGETNCGAGNQQCGYEAGKAYHVAGVNPIGPGTPIWIDPAATSMATCDSTNTNETRPFVCRGEAFVSSTPGEYVYTNTGTGPLSSLDSRFGDYPSEGKCDRSTAPPDSNIQEYAYQLFDDFRTTYTNPSDRNPYANPGVGQKIMSDWMTPMPGAQTSVCTQTGTDQYGGKIYNCPWSANGVYWSASRPDPAVSTPGVATNSNYPVTGTPYSQTNPATPPGYFSPPIPNTPSLAGRRLINLMVVQCEAAGGVCRPAKIRMVGQFLLQTRASVANDLNMEFNRKVSQDEIQGGVQLYH